MFYHNPSNMYHKLTHALIEIHDMQMKHNTPNVYEQHNQREERGWQVAIGNEISVQYSCLWDIISLLTDINLVVRDEMFFSWLEKHKSVVGSALHLDERSLISNKLGKQDNWSLNGYFAQLAHFS